MKIDTEGLKQLFSLMPPLSNGKYMPSADWHIVHESDVTRWMAKNKALLSHLFYLAVKLGHVRYISRINKWVGASMIVHVEEGSEDFAFVEERELRGPGRPRLFNVDQIMELLPDEPISVGDWAALSMAEIRISRRKFSELLREAISRGLVTQTIDGKKRICRPAVATMATMAKTSKGSNNR